MMRVIIAVLGVFVLYSCTKDELPVSAFKESYLMLRKSNPEDVIVQDKLGYNIFWIIGDSYIERIEFDPSDPTKIDEHQIVNDIQSDEDYRMPLNSTLYKDKKFEK